MCDDPSEDVAAFHRDRRRIAARFSVRSLVGAVVGAAIVFFCARELYRWDIHRGTRISVQMQDRSVRTVCNYQGRVVFGRRVSAAHLVNLVTEHLRNANDVRRAGGPTDPGLDERVVQAIRLLSEVRDPRAFDFLVQILQQPASGWLFEATAGFWELGDPRAIPHLLARLEYTRDLDERMDIGYAVARIGDIDTGVPIMIEALRPERSLEGIAEVTGLSLDRLWTQWADHAKREARFGEFKEAVHDWWRSNKHLASRQHIP